VKSLDQFACQHFVESVRNEEEGAVSFSRMAAYMILTIHGLDIS
jgi:hypothetical protein